MATGTDPLQRDQIGIVSQDTGARLRAPDSNPLLQLSQAVSEVQPAIQQTMDAVAQQKQADAEAQAKQAAIETSGADLADAVRMGKIKPTQNPWFVQAYTREAAALKSTDQLNQLQTDSQSWAERTDPAAFAKRWHEEVANVAANYTDPDAIKGFLPAEAQATQQVLATNQAVNAKRIEDERQQNLSALASDALQRVVQAGGGHVSGSAAALALAPAKQQWIATGGSLDDWNKIAISAVTTASYSIRSPHLLDLLKDPALINGPRENDNSSYGDGVDDTTPQLPTPLQPVQAPAPKGEAPAVSTGAGMRLQPPALGRITNTFAQHEARGSAGVDIAVPVGTKLTTPIAGVAHIGQDPRSGLFVKITSPDGRLVQVLAHLSATGIQNGQQVGAGDVVGRSGRSGDATGPHVHWQLKVDGKQVDPMAYQASQQASDQAHAPAEAAAGVEAPELAPAAQAAPTQQTIQPGPMGPSLYDIAGVADQVESDRYRINAAVNNEATDKLQAMVAQRKLDALQATDRLYSTFGTALLTGDVTLPTIVATLTKGGYTPQVIAGAVANVQDAVANSSSLGTARLRMADADPSHAHMLFQTEVEARTKGYTPELESRIGNMVLSGDVSGDDAARWVGEAVARTENIQAESRAQTSFDERQQQLGTPGETIRKAGDLKRGLDTYTSQAVAHAEQLVPGQRLGVKSTKNLNTRMRLVVLNYLATHPNDWAGAEQQARDFVAHFLENVAAAKGKPLTVTSSPATPGANPRR